MAVSSDGFIAKKDGNSDWVSKTDSKIFEEKCREKGCVVLGRRTFEQFYGSLYPFNGVTNIILTRDINKISGDDNVKFVNSPQEALKAAKDLGHPEILLIGGGTANGLFIRENLIDEMFLSIHPIILGDGIKLFEGVEKSLIMETFESKNLDEGLVQVHYKLKNI